MVVLGALCHSMAGTLEAHFTNFNCSITYPNGWMIAKTPPTGMLVAGLSTNRQMTVALASFQIKPGDETKALPQMNANLKALMTKGGQAVTEGQKTVGGISFHTFAGNMGPKMTAVAYTASVGGRLYMIQTSSETDNAGTDPAILSVVNSFHLLSAPPKTK